MSELVSTELIPAYIKVQVFEAGKKEGWEHGNFQPFPEGAILREPWNRGIQEGEELRREWLLANAVVFQGASRVRGKCELCSDTKHVPFLVATLCDTHHKEYEEAVEKHQP